MARHAYLAELMRFTGDLRVTCDLIDASVGRGFTSSAFYTLDDNPFINKAVGNTKNRFKDKQEKEHKHKRRFLDRSKKSESKKLNLGRFAHRIVYQHYETRNQHGYRFIDRLIDENSGSSNRFNLTKALSGISYYNNQQGRALIDCSFNRNLQVKLENENFREPTKQLVGIVARIIFEDVFENNPYNHTDIDKVVDGIIEHGPSEINNFYHSKYAINLTRFADKPYPGNLSVTEYITEMIGASTRRRRFKDRLKDRGAK